MLSYLEKITDTLEVGASSANIGKIIQCRVYYKGNKLTSTCKWTYELEVKDWQRVI